MRMLFENGHHFDFFLVSFRTEMQSQGPHDISRLLDAWSGGDRRALDDLMSIVYPEIRKIARQRLGRGTPPTLESAALANEAYLRLFRARGIHCENRLKFLALCARVIRRIVGEYARAGRYAKRGGSAVRVPLDEAMVGTPAHGLELLALDEALDLLSELDSRKCKLVELHCFGGLTIDESAKILGISPETAKRDWKMAKAWLQVHLAGDTTTRA